MLEAAADIGVHKSQVMRWVQLADAGELGDLPPKGADASNPSLEEEVRRLQRENALLREEREILKKAAVFFANETR